MVSEHQREMAFLKQAILYDGSGERRKLEQSIAQVLRDQGCVRRVACVPALLLLLVIAGFGYGAILNEDFPYNGSEVVYRILCEIGLASLICLVAFAGVLTLYRLKLSRLREECRRLVKRLLESHLGKPHIPTLPGSQREPDNHAAFSTKVVGPAFRCHGDL
jgi:hypothetical protein